MGVGASKAKIRRRARPLVLSPRGKTGPTFVGIGVEFMSHRFEFALGSALLSLIARSIPALAGCAIDGQPEDDLRGVDGKVQALTTWDPDGPGPRTSLLIAGGDFTKAGEAEVDHIASWDGTNWHSLGSGLDDSVFALTVHDGKLIAGGKFIASGSVAVKRVACWDGRTWTALGGSVNYDVQSLAVYDGKLIVGGLFNKAGGKDAYRIARWDGVTWEPLGNGTQFWPLDIEVYAGNIVAAGGGARNCVARWDGTDWQDLRTGEEYAPVRALVVSGGKLIAGGDFRSMGDQSVEFVAAWSGESWSPVGTNIVNGVWALVTFRDELIAAGACPLTVGGGCIARWDGTSWQPMDRGMDSGVHAITVYDGELIAGGSFQSAGGVPASHIARWDGKNWKTLGLQKGEPR